MISSALRRTTDFFAGLGMGRLARSRGCGSLQIKNVPKAFSREVSRVHQVVGVAAFQSKFALAFASEFLKCISGAWRMKNSTF